MLVGYGFGASFVALFAQLGGGIYTKAADVGADLCGKVEMNIPEDDPRNPAVIADLVGDNVGDCAARGADLFESIAAEIISAMILGATVVRRSDMSVVEAKGFVLFPLVVHAMDCFASAIGILSVSEIEPRYKQEPYSVLKRGYNVALAIALVCFGIACRCMLYTEKAEDAWKYFLRVWYSWHFVRILLRVHRAVLHRLRVSASQKDCRSEYDWQWHECHRWCWCWSRSDRGAGYCGFHRRRRGVSFRAKCRIS